MKTTSLIVFAALFAGADAIKQLPPVGGAAGAQDEFGAAESSGATAGGDTAGAGAGAGAGTADYAIGTKGAFAAAAKGPYAKDTDHLSTECYGADEDDIMYDVFERYHVEEKNPQNAGTGVYKLPKYSGPEWANDIITHFHVMDDDKVAAYVAANFDNFWHKYDNNGSGEIYESEGETFMRALLGPNNRFRLAEGALSDMDSSAQ
jgi:hypothetical protein